jgi:hypothetical protein
VAEAAPTPHQSKLSRGELAVDNATRVGGVSGDDSLCSPIPLSHRLTSEAGFGLTGPGSSAEPLLHAYVPAGVRQLPSGRAATHREGAAAGSSRRGSVVIGFQPPSILVNPRKHGEEEVEEDKPIATFIAATRASSVELQRQRGKKKRGGDEIDGWQRRPSRPGDDTEADDRYTPSILVKKVV